MKSKKNLLNQLKSLPYFGKDAVLQLGEQMGLEATTISTYISRFLKEKDIVQLKKGLYVTADFLQKHQGDYSYPLFLANIIRQPSYVSSWSALQYYDLATEAVRMTVSVTTKVTRTHRTRAGSFAYRSIDAGRFTGFSLVKGKAGASTGAFDFYVASPSKALFDMLYFKTKQLRGFTPETALALAKDLRVEVDEMSKEEIAKFYALFTP